ncbi:hypothetical protein ES319_D13G048200v1 [Gossypium barbadense]|uniref:Uncharacterized protein n=1 Tax=Gossypium barbadense TaxID=3634 RepID=A0A5J5NH51_GOSBA|nr:hypothetical protein ES319_D13G048200v1 [Gossypium barbadense]
MEVEVDEEELKSVGAEFLFFRGREIESPATIFVASGWKHEGLPPVEVPSAAQWKFRSKPFQQVILDYDCGSDMVELDSNKNPREEISEGSSGLHWEDCTLRLDGSIHVCYAVMPSSWFLLQFWVMLLRLWGTRIHCVFDGSAHPAILRERCWKEGTYQSLSTQKGYPTDSAAYGDPSISSQRLPVIVYLTQKLLFPGNL